MNNRLVVTTVTLISAACAIVVRAEPGPVGSLGLGAGFGGLSHVSGFTMIGFDVRWRRGEALWLHAAAGGGGPSPGLEGSIAALRFGIERERRDCGRGCLYVGADLAVLLADVVDGPDETHARGLLAVPRAGLDVGGDTLRLRLGAEVWLGGAWVHDLRPSRTVPIDERSARVVGGFALTAGVALQF